MARHFERPSLSSIGFTSYWVMTSFRHATPPDLLIASVSASAIWWRSPRMLNVELPTGPARLMADTAMCSVVGVTPWSLAVRPLQRPGVVGVALAAAPVVEPPVLGAVAIP